MITLFVIVALAVAAPPAGGVSVLADTNYAIPDNALFVSTTGSDAASGRIDAPFRTIEGAISHAPEGATLVIRQGVYRETPGALNTRLTLQPYPHERVWIKGSAVVTGWLPDAGAWRKDEWKSTFRPNTYEVGEITAEHPLAGRPEMVIIDGRQLKQVDRRQDVKPGTFYIDDGKHALFIGDDPRGKTIEAAQFGHALELSRGASGSIIRGLGFAHYGNVKYEGAIRIAGGASKIVLENNTFADNAGSALLLYECNDVTLRQNMFLRAGYQGLSTWKANGLTIEANRFLDNNLERFAIEGEYAGAAGAKIFAAKDVLVRKNEFRGNHCTGLWFDGSCQRIKVLCNRFSKNGLAGVHVEESAQAMVVGNVAEENSGPGIYISNSSDVRVYNNRLVDNGRNLAIQDDARVNSNAQEREAGITYITAGVQLFNNVMIGTRGDNPMLWARDYNSSPRKSADEMVEGCDYNVWQYPKSSSKAVVEWWGKTSPQLFQNLAGFQQATGRETHGIAQPSIGAPAAEKTTGRDLPDDIARELGTKKAVGVGTLDGCP